MGMYTELVCAFELPADTTPQSVIDTLKVMVGQPVVSIYTEKQPDHELFQTSRWEFMLRSDSYYFQGDTHSSIRKDNLYKDNRDPYYVNIRCNLKNYDNEIEKFIDWISLYILKEHPLTNDDKMFIGYKRYEEDAEPTLIYI